MTRSIAFVRTPFQAWIFNRIIEIESVSNITLVYITTHDVPEDRLAYQKLLKKVNMAFYLYNPIQESSFKRHWQLKKIINRLSLRPYYEIGYISSIDMLVLRAFLRKRTDRIISFDDGTANVFENSPHKHEDNYWYNYVFRFLFSSGRLNDFIKKIDYHYTVFEGLDNIVPQSRLKLITGFKTLKSLKVKSLPRLNVFIAQPFQEWFTFEEQKTMYNYYSEIDIHWYIEHPREGGKRLLDVPNYDKQGMIAEEIILKLQECHEVHLYGGFSTVMLNLKDLVFSINIALIKGSKSYDFSKKTLDKFNMTYMEL